MHFIYEKYITLASNNDYDIKSIFEWLIVNLDVEDYFKGTYKPTPEDFIDECFLYPEVWIDKFITDLCIEQDVVNNINNSDIANQIEELLYDKLVNYYTDNWQEFVSIYKDN